MSKSVPFHRPSTFGPIFILLFSTLALITSPTSSASVGEHHTKRHTCSHAYIVAAFANACKEKRSGGEKLVESQSGSAKSYSELEDDEVLAILSNSLYLYESWTAHGKKEEEPSTSTSTNSHWSKVRAKVQAASRRWRGRRVTFDPEQLTDPTQNEVETNEDNNEVRNSIKDNSAKMWGWVVAQLEGKLGGKGRVRRNPQEVWKAVENCCRGDVCEFNCD